MEKSIRETRIRNLTKLYYSKPEIQKAIFDFSKNREIAPRYFEGFGKRPDSFQYPSDIFELVQRGATSFHCSEELWKNPLDIQTGMTQEQANELRIGWDLLIDIDCKWFDYAKLAAIAIVKTLKNHKVKNIGIKFSGSKGFHIIVPWKAFPKEISGEKSENLFPEVPRKIISYLRYESEKELKKILPDNFYEQFKDVKIKKGVKCNNCNEIAEEYRLKELYCPKCKRTELKKIINKETQKYFCPDCKEEFELKSDNKIYECKKCRISSDKNPNNFTSSIEVDLFDLMGLDVILVSPRHLFRMPYSLHEKTSLSSVVLNLKELENFDLKDADAMNVVVKDFMPNSIEGEAQEFVLKALDWSEEKSPTTNSSLTQNSSFKQKNFQKVQITNFSEKNFPPCVKKILQGVEDGKKRALFVLINFFRFIELEQDKLEEIISSWNKKNKPPLREGYIKAQLSWSYKKQARMPPNCRAYYREIGVCQPDQLCSKIKNPVNYIIIKNLSKNGKRKKTRKTK